MRPVWWIALLATAVLGGIAGALATRALAPGVDAASGTVVRDYLLKHPEVLPEAMQRLQARESAKAVDGSRRAIETPFPGAVAGNPAGDVTLVAYMDYACGYCRASLPAIERLIESDPQLRVVYRELPILSPGSRSAAEMALAAAGQGRYLPFHNALYAGGRVDADAIARAASAAGLDVAAARTAAASPAVAAEIARNLDTAGRIGVTGTPSWVVGDQVLSGAQGFEALRDAVAAARAKRG